jgi:glutamate dehydrogenase
MNKTKGSDIIEKASNLQLNPGTLYEAVIDLSAEGLLTASSVNMAANILLDQLALPSYFFKNISATALKSILLSIAKSIRIQDGVPVLSAHVAEVNFDIDNGAQPVRVRIATEETRDNMEPVLEELIPGHRREYYYSPESKYYTYIIRPETVADFDEEEFSESRYLFALAGDYEASPEPTRKRYEKFMKRILWKKRLKFLLKNQN